MGSIFSRARSPSNFEDALCLRDAARCGDVSEVQRLLSRNSAILSDADPMGMTPLMWAAWNGHVTVMQLLIAAGACIHKTDRFGNGVMAVAAEEERVNVLQWIAFECGAEAMNAHTRKRINHLENVWVGTPSERHPWVKLQYYNHKSDAIAAWCNNLEQYWTPTQPMAKMLRLVILRLRHRIPPELWFYIFSFLRVHSVMLLD